MADEIKLFDFGFSLTTEEDLKKTEQENLRHASQKLSETQEKLIGLKNMIWPLLENLKKDPGKDIIRWPNRLTVINDFMAKINAYIADA